MTFRLHMTLHSLSVFNGQYRHSSSVYCKTWTKKNSLYINMQIKYALSVSVHVEDFISSLAHSSFYQFTQKNTITFKNTRQVPVIGCNVSRYHKLEVFVAAKLGCVYSKQVWWGCQIRKPETCWLCSSSVPAWGWTIQGKTKSTALLIGEHYCQTRHEYVKPLTHML